MKRGKKIFKNWFWAFSVILFVLISSSFAIATGDIAYIYRRNFKIDSNIINIFNDLGFDVDLIHEDNIGDLSGYKFIFVGDENFRRNIPVNDFPSIIMNYYHGNTWGLTDFEGVSQLGSSNPLSVTINGHKVKVYTKAFSSDRITIPYYYIDKTNRGDSLFQIAGTETTSSGYKFGDVISYVNKGSRMENGKIQNGNMCFFGVIKSNYWTNSAKELFKECVGFVAAACSEDIDCGEPVRSGPFCFDGDVYESEESFMCLNAGFGDAECSSNSEDKLVEICSDYCDEGSCQDFECEIDEDCNDGDELTEDVCVNPETKESFCRNGDIECFVDIDCGIDNYIGDLYCSDDNVASEFEIFNCENPGTSESFCESEIEEREVLECADACVSGECVGFICDSNDDCDDSNDFTFDECINPGTVESECRNTVLNCNVDLDCGTEGFVGELACSGDAIIQNFQNAECVNSGTPLSFCDIDVSSEIVLSCDFACVDGGCIRCNENLDCGDGDEGTVDLCHNPGRVGAFCSNDFGGSGIIACDEDLDCGSISIISNLFCSVDNVNQLVRTWSCNNPGETISYCSSNIVQETVESCSNFCISGQCLDIECFNHDECDDGDDLTLDICNEPGSVESFCSFEEITVICDEDSDCGEDIFISDEICFEENVNRLFREYNCRNPGTDESFCESKISQEIVEDCDVSCSGGECVDNGQCDSGNDCGNDGFIDEPFCYGNDLLQDYESFMCSNPGEIYSLCNSEIEAIKFDNCDYACFDGKCVRCDEDFDCNDGDEGTEDVCMIPDSDDSYCENNPIDECEDECVGGVRECLDDSSFQLCRDFDGDGCTEWSEVEECGFNDICWDGYCV